MLPLIERCIVEHDALIARAGAGELIRANGWLEAFRTPAAFERGVTEAGLTARRHGRHHAARCRRAERARTEPRARLLRRAALARSESVVDPSALVKAYAQLFVQGGGTLLTGDAASLDALSPGWQVRTQDGMAAAPAVVVALGPWSDTVFGKFGYTIRCAKRGYHMHYAPSARGVPSAPIVDREYGYVIAPMKRGLRLTTGVEIARRGVPPTGVQLERAERVARPCSVSASGSTRNPGTASGRARPMRPVIGPRPRIAGCGSRSGTTITG